MIVSATLPITAFTAASWVDRALSEDASTLRELINAAAKFSGSVTVGEPKRRAQQALMAVFLAAQVDGWDSVGNKRAEPSTYEYAACFLDLLPRDASLPEMTVDTDGEILFEWDRGRREVFAVSVGRDGTLTYAGLFGHSKIHGTEHLGEALPMVISECLKRLSK